MKKTFVIGDIHGAYKALMQCLERSNFNKDEDTLIQLGDVADGWSEVYECVEELLTIKNLIAIKGNHDDWFKGFIEKGVHPVDWKMGGGATRTSYLRNTGLPNWYTLFLHSALIPDSHKKFFEYQHLYYIDKRGRLFVHGGYNRMYSIVEVKAMQPHEFYWDRKLWSQALGCAPGERLMTVDNFEEIFLGHTSTTFWPEKEETTKHGIIISVGDPTTRPMNSGGVWNLDTGAGWDGKLTIMNIETKEYWQSDLVTELYNKETGRI